MKITLAREKLLLCLLLCAAALPAYWPITRCGFVDYDDTEYVTHNYNVQAGLTWRGAAWAFSSGECANWHPLTWLSHQLDAQLYGLQPAGHHLTSLFLHLANTLLLFLLLNKMTGAIRRSALVAALFALHPTHVESVAWVSERKDVLSAFFFLLTLWAYARYAECRRKNAECRMPVPERGSSFCILPSAFYLFTLVCFALGLMSKPMVVTVPFVLLLLDYWPLGRMQKEECRMQKGEAEHTARSTPRARRFIPHPSSFILLEKIPFFLLSALSSAVTYLVQHAGGATVSTAELSLAGRISNALVSYSRYLGKLVWPADLAVFYPRPAQWAAWQIAGSAVLLVAITLLAVRLLSRRPYAAVGWFWFLGTLVPVIGLVQVGEQALADRYTYIPYIGLFIAIAWGAAEIARRSKFLKALTWSVLLCALAVLVAATHRQTLHWRSTETLFRQAVAVTENNPMAREILAGALLEAGDLDEAEQHAGEALRLQPGFVEAEITLANILARRGNYEEAASRLAEVLRKNPRDWNTHFSLAQAFKLSGETARAIEQYRLGLRLKPEHPDALNNLAWILATHPDAALRNGSQAVELAERACALTRHRRPMLVGTLAAAYAEAGQFDKAIAAAQKARALALASGQEDLAHKNSELLNLYQGGQPYREPTEP